MKSQLILKIKKEQFELRMAVIEQRLKIRGMHEEELKRILDTYRALLFDEKFNKKECSDYFLVLYQQHKKNFYLSVKEGMRKIEHNPLLARQAKAVSLKLYAQYLGRQR